MDSVTDGSRSGVLASELLHDVVYDGSYHFPGSDQSRPPRQSPRAYRGHRVHRSIHQHGAQRHTGSRWNDGVWTGNGHLGRSGAVHRHDQRRRLLSAVRQADEDRSHQDQDARLGASRDRDFLQRPASDSDYAALLLDFRNRIQEPDGYVCKRFIYTFLQTSLEIMFQSPVGIVLVVLISQIFWVLGIHGGLVISPIRNPLMAAAIAANIAAASSGAVPDQPVTYGFWMNFVVPGGAGCILSLIIAIMLFSKRDDYREVAKFGLPSTVCGIPEPVYFGLPVVLNPTFAIPLAITSPISTAIAMFATNIGFLPCNTVDVPLGLPVLISPFISHGWQGVVVQIICIAVTTAIWVPFVLISNRQAKLEQEKEAAALEEAEVDATYGVN